MSEPERYVLIRVAGRGDWRVYHRLAADDSSPACGAPIQHDDWDVTKEQTARRISPSGRGRVRRCCSRCEKTTHTGGTHGKP